MGTRILVKNGVIVAIIERSLGGIPVSQSTPSSTEERVTHTNSFFRLVEDELHHSKFEAKSFSLKMTGKWIFSAGYLLYSRLNN